MYDFTNIDPVKCCTWLVLPTVYDESLSYGEQLNKFCKALNELIENNNNIPQYVAEMIQNYITSGAIDEVVRNILANYILNVKYPPKGITPAVGDGSADDTDTIQGCIDYAFNQGGGCVYFPYGKYLSRSLTLRSGVSLVGFDRYSTKIVQRGGDTKPLLSGVNIQNAQISNLTLDGNNEVQTDDLDVINVLGKDCLFTNLVIKSGFQCFVYDGLGGDLQVDNVVFGGAVKKVAVINGKDSVQFENVKFNELGQIQGECVLEVGSSDGVYRFSSKAITPVCIKCVGNRNSFIVDIINSTNNFVDAGSMNNFNVLGVEIKEQLAQGKSSNVMGNATENITGSKTETVGAGKVENITGSKTETVSAGKVENITGSKTEVISENKSEHITGNREIDIDGTDSIHVDGVSSVNIGGTRTEVFANSRSVGVSGVNTEEYHNTMNETFDSKHNVYGVNETNTFTGNVINKANKFSFETTQKSFPISFPDKTVDLYNIDLNNIINVKDYGAVGDGVTDDTEAINNAILAGNSSKKIVQFESNKTYNISKIDTLVSCNIDFNYSTILIKDNSEYIFKCGEPKDSFTILSNILTERSVADSRLFNKSFTITTPVLLGTRSTTNDVIYQKIHIITDSQGNFINTFIPKIIDGSYVISNLHELSEPLYFKNATIKYNSQPIANFFINYQDNVTFNNFNVIGSVNSTDWSGATFSIHDCFGVTFRNINGKNPVSSPASGYIIGLYETSNSLVEDCILTDFTTSWGAIGCSQICNAKFKHVITNRFDIHYYLNGYYNCDECTMGKFQFSGGVGDINLNSCTIFNSISLRDDLPVLLSGTLNILNCYSSITNDYLVNISNTNTSQSTYDKIFKSFKLIIKNHSYRDKSLVLCNMSNSHLQSGINIFVENCELFTRTAINTVNEINKIIFKNVFGSYSFSYPVKIFIVQNSTISMTGNNNTVKTLIATNCIFNDISYNLQFPTLIFCNNILTIDKNNSIASTNYVVNNNIITSDTKVNLSSWNKPAV